VGFKREVKSQEMTDDESGEFTDKCNMTCTRIYNSLKTDWDEADMKI